MQKRGQASPDDGDALQLTFAQAVAPAEVEEREEEDLVGGYGISGFKRAASCAGENYSFRTLSLPSSPTKATPKHAPEAMSPRISAPCSASTRGLLRLEKNDINPNSTRTRPTIRLCTRQNSAPWLRLGGLLHGADDSVS